jgi:FkbM family methyltransferase
MTIRVLERSVNLIPWQARHWIKRIPMVAGLQRLFFRKFLSGREFLHTINAGPAKGLAYPISLPRDKAIWTGTYERELAGAVAGSVRQGDVCYDIGAHRGFFSGVFALAGASRVIAFEPFPDNCAQLQRLFANNPHLPLTFEQTAVGRDDGIVEFNVMPDSSMGKLASSSFQPDVESAAVLKVSVRSLDSLISEGKYPAPQIIKIDVEGAEVDVLQGAKNTLLKNKPLLFIEAHSKLLAAECTTLLEGLDYRVSVFEDEPGREQSASLDVCHLVATPR